MWLIGHCSIKNFFSLDEYLIPIWDWGFSSNITILIIIYWSSFKCQMTWYSISRRKSCEKFFWDGELQAEKQS